VKVSWVCFIGCLGVSVGLREVGGGCRGGGVSVSVVWVYEDVLGMVGRRGVRCREVME
jgi:hypothetical protein